MDMIGWLLRIIIKQEVNAYATLMEVGKIHANLYDLSVSSYYAMLNALHKTFCELFPRKYDLKMRYIFDNVLLSSIMVMNMANNNQNKSGYMIKDKHQVLTTLYFLSDLDTCLYDDIGCEYMYHYLNQSYCNELPKFLILYNQFKHCNPSNHRLKYNVALKIYDNVYVILLNFKLIYHLQQINR